MNSDRRLRILVVDDHDVVHWGFRLMLGEQQWVERFLSARTTDEALEVTESDAPRIEDAVWSLLRRERVREVLRTLPEPQREALTLAYFGGYTQREIAGLTSTPLGTVKTRMLAGMRRMKESLDGMSNAAGGQEPPDQRSAR